MPVPRGLPDASERRIAHGPIERDAEAIDRDAACRACCMHLGDRVPRAIDAAKADMRVLHDASAGDAPSLVFGLAFYLGRSKKTVRADPPLPGKGPPFGNQIRCRPHAFEGQVDTSELGPVCAPKLLSFSRRLSCSIGHSAHTLGR